MADYESAIGELRNTPEAQAVLGNMSQEVQDFIMGMAQDLLGGRLNSMNGLSSMFEQAKGLFDSMNGSSQTLQSNVQGVGNVDPTTVTGYGAVNQGQGFVNDPNIRQAAAAKEAATNAALDRMSGK
ncbi:MAG: hypothetical protein COV36_01115 [Alphaproteobacteria bacterium CG11_big_fil_rev_8_21_14_0_20_44_7]|nr:MAG: hypothetical protein COV36_01115 [Alphaproteobacteria bacterium CG11_big_fil_rev_8_21_14_0_20_44_7]